MVLFCSPARMVHSSKSTLKLKMDKGMYQLHLIFGQNNEKIWENSATPSNLLKDNLAPGFARKWTGGTNLLSSFSYWGRPFPAGDDPLGSSFLSIVSSSATYLCNVNSPLYHVWLIVKIIVVSARQYAETEISNTVDSENFILMAEFVFRYILLFVTLLYCIKSCTLPWIWILLPVSQSGAGIII